MDEGRRKFVPAANHRHDAHCGRVTRNCRTADVRTIRATASNATVVSSLV